MAKHKYLLEIEENGRVESLYFPTQSSVFKHVGKRITKDGCCYDGFSIKHYKYLILDNGKKYRMTRIFENWKFE